MAKLFGINVSGLIHRYVSPGVFDATLIKVVAGTPTAGELAGDSNPTETSHSARGFIDQQAFADRPDAPLVNYDSRTVVLVGDSIAGLAVPEPGDRIVIEDTTYIVDKVGRDPAKATYSCLVRAR